MRHSDTMMATGIATTASMHGATEKNPNTSEPTMANTTMPSGTIMIARTVTKDGATSGGGKTTKNAVKAAKARFHMLLQARSVSGLVFLTVFRRQSHPYRD